MACDVQRRQIDSRRARFERVCDTTHTYIVCRRYADIYPESLHCSTSQTGLTTGKSRLCLHYQRVRQQRLPRISLFVHCGRSERSCTPPPRGGEAATGTWRRGVVWCLTAGIKINTKKIFLTQQFIIATDCTIQKSSGAELASTLCDTHQAELNGILDRANTSTITTCCRTRGVQAISSALIAEPRDGTPRKRLVVVAGGCYTKHLPRSAAA